MMGRCRSVKRCYPANMVAARGDRVGYDWFGKSPGVEYFPSGRLLCTHCQSPIRVVRGGGGNDGQSQSK
jgi:hypothetical protein